MLYIMSMSTEKKNPIKRDHSLNDATSGQMGEEPRLVHSQSRWKETKTHV